MGESTSNEGTVTTDGNALPNRDPPDVTRFASPAAKRVQAHRARARHAVQQQAPLRGWKRWRLRAD